MSYFSGQIAPGGKWDYQEESMRRGRDGEQACVPEFGEGQIRSELSSRFGVLSLQTSPSSRSLTNYVLQTLGETDFFASICQSSWQDFRNMSHLGLTSNTGLRVGCTCGHRGQFPRAPMPKGLRLCFIICHLNIKKKNHFWLPGNFKGPSDGVYTLTATFVHQLLGLWVS